MQRLLRSLGANRNIPIREICAFVAAFAATRGLFAPGVLGYQYDWNIPSAANALHVWGTADFSPWLRASFGMPTTYASAVYLKGLLGFLGALGMGGSFAAALLLFCCYWCAFSGAARLVQALFSPPLFVQIACGALYALAPIHFMVTVLGYITFNVSYALMPWVLLFAMRAVRGERWAYPAFACAAALALSQLQFVLFEVLALCALFIGLRTPLGPICRIAAWWAASLGVSFAFIALRFAGGSSELERVAKLSSHSWLWLKFPGLFGALSLEPSVYRLYDTALGGSSDTWHRAACIFSIVVLVGALLSQNRVSRSFSVLLLSCVLLLGANSFGLSGIVSTAYEHISLLAMFRNVNYFFALYALALVLLVPSAARALPKRATEAVLSVFVLVLAWPFWSGDFSGQLKPLRGQSAVQTIVDPAERDYVFPLAPLDDDRGITPGGINFTAADVLSPTFITPSPTGMYEAALTDRVTSREPIAENAPTYFRMGGIANAVVQKHLISDFARYVNAYNDPWLFDALQPDSISEHLSRNLQAGNLIPGLDVFPIGPGFALLGADKVIPADASFGEVAAIARSAGDGIAVPARLITDRQIENVAGAYVRTALRPPLSLSPQDTAEARMDAGYALTANTSDFHQNWTEPLSSSNWWLTPRLLQTEAPAITDAPDVAFAVTAPPGRRHVFLQYFISFSGGSLAASCGRTQHIINTKASTYGYYDWLDCGVIDVTADHTIHVVSQSGFNAVGEILMLDPPAEQRAARRYVRLQSLPTATLLADVSIPGEQRFRVDSSDTQEMVLSSPTDNLSFVAHARLISSNSRCRVQIEDISLRDFSMKIDGKPVTRKNASVQTPDFPCPSRTAVYLDSTLLKSPTQLVSFSGQSFIVRLFSVGAPQVIGEHSYELPRLPLGVHLPGAGVHMLRFSPLSRPLPLRRWSEPEDAAPGEQGPFTGSRIVDAAPDSLSLKVSGRQGSVYADLGDVERGTLYRIWGDYTCSNGAMRIVLWDSALQEAIEQSDLPHTIGRREFTMIVSPQRTVHGARLYVSGLPEGPHYSAEVALHIHASEAKAAPISLSNWSQMEDAENGLSGIFVGDREVWRQGEESVLSLQARTHSGDTHVPFGPLFKSTHYHLQGTYTVPDGAFRIAIWDIAKQRLIAQAAFSKEQEARPFALDFISEQDVSESSLYVYALPLQESAGQRASVSLTLKASAATMASADLAVISRGFAFPPSRPLGSRELGTDALQADGPMPRIVEFAETYDPFWSLNRGENTHMQSVQGFNVWLTNGGGGNFAVSYKTRRTYPAVLAAGCLWLTGLAFASIWLRRQRADGASTS